MSIYLQEKKKNRRTHEERHNTKASYSVEAYVPGSRLRPKFIEKRVTSSHYAKKESTYKRHQEDSRNTLRNFLRGRADSFHPAKSSLKEGLKGLCRERVLLSQFRSRFKAFFL